MPEDLRFEPGAHVCHLLRDFADQKAVVLPFFKEGLEKDETCLLIASEQWLDDWYFEFQAYGMDVEQTTNAGRLRVLPPSRGYGTSTTSIGGAREVVSLLGELLARSKGVRIVGHAAWAMTPEITAPQLCHWEATANLVYKDLEVRAVCQYDLTKCSNEEIHGALRTHQTVLIDRVRRQNPYYEAPLILENEPRLNQSSGDPAVVEAMLARLRSG